MFLQKCILVNWGNIPAGELDLGPVNLLSGGNGSGKTTLADAIQALMTAAHDNLFQFNPGQEESTQRARGKQVRTLASYVLGCDDGSYARLQPTVGWLAGVFQPTRGESGEPFTAVMGLSARLESQGEQRVARLQDQHFYIVPGETLSLEDFVSQGEQVVPLSRFNGRLAQRLGGAAGLRLETKKSYLRQLYAAVRGQSEAVSEREALHAARTFSRFMAYKPVRSIHDFVAGEILEPHDLGDAIRSVSELMKTIHAMDAEAVRLSTSAERLGQAEQAARAYQAQWLDHEILHYGLAHARYQGDQAAFATARRAQTDLTHQLADARSQRELADRQREDTRQRQVRLEAERLGVPELRDRAEQEAQLAALDAELSTSQADWNRELDHVAEFSQIADWVRAHQEMLEQGFRDEFPGLDLAGLWPLHASAEQARTRLDAAVHRLSNTDWVNSTDQEDQLRRLHQAEAVLNRYGEAWSRAGQLVPDQSLREALVRLVDRSEQGAANTWRSLQDATQAQNEVATGRVAYPGPVRAALALLQHELPEARPSVLCDHVEIRDPAWQSSVEAYLGPARFTLLVEAESEAGAAELLRRAEGPAGRARVAQGTQAQRDAERRPAMAGSLPELLECHHAVAQAYLTANYGSVQCVDSVEDLRHTRRGIARQGVGSGGYALYRCQMPAADCVFGRAARDQARLAREETARALEVRWQAEHEQAEHLRACLQQVDRLTPVRLYALADRRVALYRRRQELQDALAGARQEQYRSFDDEQAALDEQLAHLDGEIRRQDAAIGRFEEQLAQCDRLCADLNKEQDKTETALARAAQELARLHQNWPGFDLAERRRKAEEDAGQTDLHELERQRSELQQTMTRQLRWLEDLTLAHNQHSNAADGIVFQVPGNDRHDAATFDQVAGLHSEFARQYERLRHHVLVSKLDQIARLRDSFNDTFVTNLCHAIYHAIHEGKRALEELNQELAHHRFGADREGYWFDWDWVPEFREYWEFFREVTQAPGLGEKQTLFTLELSAGSAKIRDQLLNMLLDTDEERARRELARIADYRNYRQYEIYKQPEGKAPIALSRYGTGSGGQLETPAYIIRAAAITSAFRFGRGDTHLRMVLVDEAFSKMDEARSREVIGYLTQSLGLQLLFIMPTNKSGPFMDLVSHQFVFAKVPLRGGARLGELGSRVLLDRQRLNRERVKELWANHRRVIRRQAELDFMAAFE